MNVLDDQVPGVSALVHAVNIRGSGADLSVARERRHVEHATAAIGDACVALEHPEATQLHLVRWQSLAVPVLRDALRRRRDAHCRPSGARARARAAAVRRRPCSSYTCAIGEAEYKFILKSLEYRTFNKNLQV